jgi:hypothetical protein
MTIELKQEERKIIDRIKKYRYILTSHHFFTVKYHTLHGMGGVGPL